MEEILTKWSCLTYNRTLVTGFLNFLIFPISSFFSFPISPSRPQA